MILKKLFKSVLSLFNNSLNKSKDEYYAKFKQPVKPKAIRKDAVKVYKIDGDESPEDIQNKINCWIIEARILYKFKIEGIYGVGNFIIILYSYYVFSTRRMDIND